MKNRKAAEWSRLDNAAKLFPPTSNAADPKVFRFACELCEPVEPETLRQALDRTLEAFPLYRSVLRKGLFWYYLEASEREASIHEEDTRPCAPLYDRVRKNLLFKVTYYQNRINLEVYHALSDGTGALQFLRLLAYHYLTLRHAGDFPEGPPPMDYDASFAQKKADSFRKYYSEAPPRLPEHAPSAVRVRGARLTEHRIRVIEGHLSAKAAVALAREHGASVTAFLAAALLCAIHEEIPVRYRKKPVVLTVPVNLRNYFPSESARNFFGTINVGYGFPEGWTFPDVVAAVAQSFTEELTADRLRQRMNEFSALEHNALARIMPLAAKDVVMQLANRFKKREVTGMLSNIGRIAMPEALRPYIRLFDVFTSTNRVNLCMCSYGDTMALSFTAPFVSTDIQKNFFRILSGFGLSITIHSNQPDNE
ncbi:MAG: hypothetical protein ACOX65_13205 [Anaerotruncus rubiinfantis]